MYNFLDTESDSWLLEEVEQPDGTFVLELIGEESQIARLDQLQAGELAVRLQFYAEHGRLPKEAPDSVRNWMHIERQAADTADDMLPKMYHFYCWDCKIKFSETEPKCAAGPECPICGRVNSVNDWDSVVDLLDRVTIKPKGLSRACDDIYLHTNGNKQ